jgi:hypothetical protein
VGIGGLTGRDGVDCTACHLSYGSTVQIIDDATGTTAPSAIPRGQTRAFRVRVTGGPAVLCGFNLAASGGTLIPGSGVKFDDFVTSELTHSGPKAFSSGTCDLPFSWTAPNANGPVTFWTAGNSANGDANSTGDFIGLDTHSINVIDPPVAPPNDDWPDAINLGSTGGSLFGTLLDSTPDGSDSTSASTGRGDVWYRWTSPRAGSMTVTTCGTNDQSNFVYGVDSGTDTVVSLHSGAPGTSANQLGVNDDFPGSVVSAACVGIDTGALRDSAVRISVSQGQAVYIRVAHHVSQVQGGVFALQVAPEPGAFAVAATAVVTLAAFARRPARAGGEGPLG